MKYLLVVIITQLFFASSFLYSENLRRDRFKVNQFEYSGAEEEAWLADGFRQTLVDNLSKINTIEVVTKKEEEDVDSLIRDKKKSGDKFDPILEAGKLLNVDYLITTSLFNRGDVLFFTLSIRKQPTYTVLKSFKIEGRKNNILDIQDHLIAGIINHLDLKYDNREKYRISKTHIYFIKTFELYSKGLRNSNNKADKAIEFFLQMYKTDSDYWGLLKEIAWAYYKLGDYDKSLEYYLKEKLILEQEGSVYTWTYTHCLENIGMIYLKKKKKKKALEFFSDSLFIKEKLRLANTKEYTNLLSYIGEIHQSTNNSEKALEYFENSNAKRNDIELKQTFDYAVTLNDMGIVQKNSDQLEEALKNFHSAISIMSSINLSNTLVNSDFLYNRGSAYSKKQEYDKAIEDYVLSLEIKEKLGYANVPTYSFALNDIGVAYNHLNQTEKAITYFKLAIESKRKAKGTNTLDYANFLFNLGDIYYKKKNSACEAANWMKEAIHIEERLGSSYAREDKTYYEEIHSKCEESKKKEESEETENSGE